MVTPPKLLLESLANRRCLLFVGSGLSIPAGYPNWLELVDRLIDEAAVADPEKADKLKAFAQANRDLLLVAEYARDKLGKYQYGRLLRSIFEVPREPLPVHKDIAATDYRGIITTNYDALLEMAIVAERRWLPAVFAHDSVPDLGSALYEGDRLFVFKMHGDIRRPDTIILTSQDYDRLLLRNPALRSFLQAIFLNFNLLFVGYSISDPDFQLVLKELNLVFEGTTPTHFALLPDPHEFTFDHLASRMNIRVIPYDSKGGTDHSEVATFLKELQRAQPFIPALLVAP